MLKKLKLNCYRQHTDLEINFTPGLNAIRGANEAGKSKIIEAISYAFFGSAALKEPLEGVVTYDVPVSKLRVDLDFEHAGIDYHIYRGKSGAELTFSNEVVTGQTEVTKFVERLFGASSKLANKLMIARQKELTGILEEGPTAVGGLIETLANFELLDEIIELVNTELPSGNTKSLEGRIEGLQVSSGESQLEDTTQLTIDAKDTATAEEAQAVTVSELKKQIDVALLKSARETINEHSKLSAKLDDIGKRKAVQVELSNKEIDSVCPTDEEIAALEKAVIDRVGAANLAKLYAEFNSGAVAIMPEWEGTLESLQTEHAAMKQRLSDLRGEANRLTLEKQKYTGQLIKETTCAFCDKDLTDVPEVVTRNSTLNESIKKTEALAVDVAAEIRNFTSDIADLDAVLAKHQQAQIFYAKFGNHITLATEVVPHQATWVTPPPAPGTDQSAKLAELKSLKTAHVRHQAVKEQAAAQVLSLQEEQRKVLAGLEELDTVQANAIIQQQEKAQLDYEASTRELAKLVTAASNAKHALALATTRNDQIISSAAKARKDLAEAKIELVEMQENNALIKKLREARPKITDKIWGMTLASVSLYTSDMRQTPSTVTKGEDGFKINGRSAKGLSGSAEDVLGLGIRTALVKTFLPNSSFIILDEMAAACDDNREAAMLGMIAKCGFPQVLMVTHSDQCDAYADNMIRLGA